MADEVLNIEIRVQGAKAKVSAKQAQKEVSALKTSTDSLTESTERFGDATEKAYSRSLNNATAGATKTARIALTDLGRIIQDLPFGLVAIQNNVDQAAASLGRLGAETGGGTSAMKALGATLAGPGGIIALISIAGAVFVTFGDDIKKAFSGGTASVEEFKSAIGELLSPEFDLAGFTVRTEKDARAALDAVVETRKAAQAALVEFRRQNDTVIGDDRTDEIINQINAFKALEGELEEVVARYQILETTEEALSRSGLTRKVEIDTAGFQELERFLETANSSDLSEFTIEISNARSAAEEEFARMKQVALDFLGTFNGFEVETGSIDVFLKDIKEITDAREQATREYDEQNARRVDSEQKAADEIVKAKKRERDAYMSAMQAAIATADTSIETGYAVVRAVLEQVRTIIQAKLAEAVAKQYAANSVLGPGGLLVSAAIGASLNLIFNKLMSGLGGGGSGSSASGRSQPEVQTDSGGTFTPGMSAERVVRASVSGTSSSPNQELVQEMRLTRMAIQSQKFTVRGTDLETTRINNASTYKQMGAQ